MSNSPKTTEASTAAYKLAARHYIDRMRADWKWSAPALLLSGVGSIFVFFVPVLVVAKLLGRFEGQSDLGFTDFAPYILLAAVFWMLGELLWRLSMLCLNRADSIGIEHLYISGMDELLKKDQAFFDNNFAGSLTKRITGYARKYEDFVDTIAFNVTANVVPIVFASFVLWQYTPWLVVVLLGMTVITFLVIYPFIKRRQSLVNARETSNTVLTGYVADVISNAAAVRSFAKEHKEQAQHTANTRDFTGKARRSWDYHNNVISLMTSPFYVATNILGLGVVLLATKGPVSIEAVIVTFTYFGTASRSVWEFNQIYRNIEASLGEAALFTSLLLEQPKIKDSHVATKLQPTAGLVEFKEVNFHYDDNENDKLFTDFSLTIKPGEKVGLVGRSGGGKTTLTKLLLRFVDIQSGSIEIDGQDIATVTQQSLREAISYVPQEPLLFHRSLSENISYGNTSASQEEIVSAAKLAHADDFINKLPQAYDTLVGERGVKLSGGQRQRVAIARAMLKQTPILVLDEATSALDSESEVKIQDALWKLMENRTSLVIAHRLSTIQRMDRIIVIDHGKIIEEGSHQELLAKDGVYAKLWAHQSGGFIES